MGRAEREERIAKMRTEINEFSTRVLNYKESDEHKCLENAENQYLLIVNQLEQSKLEILKLREQLEKCHSDNLVVKSESEKWTASANFELKSAKSEVACLKQVTEKLQTELQAVNKVNFEASIQCESSKREIEILRGVIN